MRAGLVLSGGGARGAYEAGVLSYLYEFIYPDLPGFEFDVASGTSVGAIHAAYTLASAHMDAENRARHLAETWSEMSMGDVLDLGWRDLLGVPLRAMGIGRTKPDAKKGRHVIGGLVDVSPLERIVEDRVPWRHLERNLDSGRGRALCISCTEVRAGRVTVFMDGRGADPLPWDHDPNARAIPARITARHVRASAAIPFLFPAVLIGDRYYVDGGLRMNTPLSPVLRLRSDRVLVVSLKMARASEDLEAAPYDEEVVTQPAFMMGKVLDALTLDQLEYELQRIDLVNAMIERGEQAFGPEYQERMNPVVRAQRGAGYRPVKAEIIRPSQDLGRLAAECYARTSSARSMGVLPSLLTRMAKQGVPDDEADLLSYLYFDGCYTSQLIDLGREDTRARHDEILELLTEGPED